MPTRCEFRQPRCFPVVAWHVDRSSSQDEKPVWCRGALRVSGEVCILPQPAQAVVQTRTLNEAWSRRPFGEMLQGEFLWTHCLFLRRDFQPNILLRLPLTHSQTFEFFFLFHQVSHLLLHLARWGNAAFIVSLVTSVVEGCNHVADQKKELLLNGDVFRLQVYDAR